MPASARPVSNANKRSKRAGNGGAGSTCTYVSATSGRACSRQRASGAMYCIEYHLCQTPKCGGAKAKVQQTCSTCTSARAAIDKRRRDNDDDNNDDDDDEGEDSDAHDYINTGKSRARHVIDEYVDVDGMDC